MKRIFLATFMLLLMNMVKAQHQEINEKPAMYKGKPEQTEDTTSLLSAFKRGDFVPGAPGYLSVYGHASCYR